MEIDGIVLDVPAAVLQRLGKYLSWARRMATRISAVMDAQGISKAKDIDWWQVEDLNSVTFEGRGDTCIIHALADGKEPVMRVAYRYGKIPEGGDSWNYRDKYLENGTSVVGRCLTQVKRSSYYDSFWGGSPYYVVMGYDVGKTGADGEMLLSGAVIVGLASDVKIVRKEA